MFEFFVKSLRGSGTVNVMSQHSPTRWPQRIFIKSHQVSIMDLAIAVMVFGTILVMFTRDVVDN